MRRPNWGYLIKFLSSNLMCQIKSFTFEKINITSIESKSDQVPILEKIHRCYKDAKQRLVWQVKIFMREKWYHDLIKGINPHSSSFPEVKWLRFITFFWKKNILWDICDMDPFFVFGLFDAQHVLSSWEYTQLFWTTHLHICLSLYSIMIFRCRDAKVSRKKPMKWHKTVTFLFNLKHKL